MRRPVSLAWWRFPPAKRRAAAALAALAGLLLLAAPSPAAAQSKSDAFAGKVPPVSSQLYRKAGRYELSLSSSLSFNDPFYSKYFGELKLGYHFLESFSAGVVFASGFSTKAGSAQVCPSNGGCHSASTTQMFQVPGNIRMIGGVEAAWAPIYGKLNVLSGVIHFDLGILGGADWIQFQKVVSSAEAEVYGAKGGHPPLTSTMGLHAGLGARVFFNEWMAARLEYRPYFYFVSVPNWQEGGGAKRDLQVQSFVDLGVSFFFPTRNRPVQ